MKPFNDYLDELRGKLKGFDDTERDEILEEVGSHIEAGVADGRFQSNPSKLRQEMGPPAEMARKLQFAHNRRRWIEMLLILVPFLTIEFGRQVASYTYSPIILFGKSITALNK